MFPVRGEPREGGMAALYHIFEWIQLRLLTSQSPRLAIMKRCREGNRLDLKGEPAQQPQHTLFSSPKK